MGQDAGIGLIYHRIEFRLCRQQFFPGCSCKMGAVAIIVAVGKFCPFDNFVEFVVGIKVPVVVRNRVLNEFAGTLKFLFGRFFSAESLFSYFLGFLRSEGSTGCPRLRETIGKSAERYKECLGQYL